MLVNFCHCCFTLEVTWVFDRPALKSQIALKVATSNMRRAMICKVESKSIGSTVLAYSDAIEWWNHISWVLSFKDSTSCTLALSTNQSTLVGNKLDYSFRWLHYRYQLSYYNMTKQATQMVWYGMVWKVQPSKASSCYSRGLIDEVI